MPWGSSLVGANLFEFLTTYQRFFHPANSARRIHFTARFFGTEAGTYHLLPVGHAGRLEPSGPAWP